MCMRMCIYIHGNVMHAFKLAYVYMYVRMYQEHLHGSHTVLTVRGVPLIRHMYIQYVIVVVCI